MELARPRRQQVAMPGIATHLGTTGTNASVIFLFISGVTPRGIIQRSWTKEADYLTRKNLRE
jgi:hypothetical protein